MSKENPKDSDSQGPIINPDDFRSIVLLMEFENLTTKVSIRDGKRYFGTKSEPLKPEDEIRFIEFLEEDTDQGMVIECPPNAGSSGHQVKIMVQSHFRGNTIKQEVIGMITESESLEKTSQRLSIRLTQFDSVAWANLKELFATRQREVLELLQSMRGH